MAGRLEWFRYRGAALPTIHRTELDICYRSVMLGDTIRESRMIAKYSIAYVRLGAIAEEGTFTGLFDAARAEAQEGVRAGECDRVQVRDPDGAIRYEYPGAASRAQ